MTTDSEPEEEATKDRRKTDAISVEQIEQLLSQGSRLEEVIAAAINAESASRTEVIDALKREALKRWLPTLLAIALLALSGYVGWRSNHDTTCANARSINRVIDEDEDTLRLIRSSLDTDGQAFIDGRLAKYEDARPSC